MPAPGRFSLFASSSWGLAAARGSGARLLACKVLNWIQINAERKKIGTPRNMVRDEIHPFKSTAEAAGRKGDDEFTVDEIIRIITTGGL